MTGNQQPLYTNNNINNNSSPYGKEVKKYNNSNLMPHGLIQQQEPQNNLYNHNHKQIGSHNSY